LYGDSVTLTATPATGSVFTGWSGACSGTGACTVTMNADREVAAAFGLSTSTATTPSGDDRKATPANKNGTGKIASAKLSKKTFTASLAKAAKLTVKFSPKSKVFKWKITLKKGKKWAAVKSSARHGSFVKKTMTVKQLFSGKKMLKGSYKLELYAERNSKTLSFRIV